MRLHQEKCPSVMRWVAKVVFVSSSILVPIRARPIGEEQNPKKYFYDLHSNSKSRRSNREKFKKNVHHINLCCLLSIGDRQRLSPPLREVQICSLLLEKVSTFTLEKGRSQRRMPTSLRNNHKNTSSHGQNSRSLVGESKLHRVNVILWCIEVVWKLSQNGASFVPRHYYSWDYNY